MPGPPKLPPATMSVDPAIPALHAKSRSPTYPGGCRQGQSGLIPLPACPPVLLPLGAGHRDLALASRPDFSVIARTRKDYASGTAGYASHPYAILGSFAVHARIATAKKNQ